MTIAAQPKNKGTSGNLCCPGNVTSRMKSLSTAVGAALLACSLAGFAQTETACDQALDARLRSRAVLAIDSLPAGLEIVGTDQEAIHLTCTAGDVEDARDIHIRFSGNQDDG